MTTPHLFRNIGKELIEEEHKRIILWNDLLKNQELSEELSNHFNCKNVDKALENFKETDEILKQIEALTSKELVDISDEEKTDDEILTELDKLREIHELEALNDDIVEIKQKEHRIRELFQEIFKILTLKLHLIRVIRNNPTKELLITLFRLIFFQEAMVFKIFKKDTFFDESKHIHFYITKITKAIILEEEIKEEPETDEEKFIKEMVKKMGIEDSRNEYRLLGENIYNEFAEMAGAPLGMNGDILKGIERMEKLMKKDKLMYKTIKKLKPKYDDAKIKMTIIAFRQSYELSHFMGFEVNFVT
ncbi:MAG: hypothetical protein WC755_03665 [Candidatus Woesearchaeota archaeon]|jgi:hypothetical protein